MQSFMNTYSFRFNNSQKTSTILFWFFTILLTIPLTPTVFLAYSNPLFPAWLLLIFAPLMLVAIYKLFKAASQRQSREILSLSTEGFSSSFFGSVLFSEIHAIRVPVREIELFGGRQPDYYKKTDADFLIWNFRSPRGTGK
jgi:hypothetical protein